MYFSNQLQYSMGVDRFEPAVRESSSAQIHHDYCVMDALEIGERFQDKSFDCVLASDLIEHLSKEEGYKLVAMMVRIARKKVILFTPNGYLPQAGYGGNKFQRHQSGWDVEEMRELGFHVIGISGWKPLRGEMGTIRWRPRALWIRISDLTQIVTTKRPEYAFQILCIKDVSNNAAKS